jgi:hypothetical protein
MFEARWWQAYAIRAVPALLLAACVARAVAIVPGWDRETELEPWVATATGLEPALPVGLVAFACLRVVWRRTGGSFSVVPLQLASGAVLLSAAAVFALTSRGTALHEAGPGFPAPNGMADWGMLAVLAAVSLAVVMLIASICYLYAQAITPEGSVKWDRQSDERDATGEIVRGQPGYDRR